MRKWRVSRGPMVELMKEDVAARRKFQVQSLVAGEAKALVLHHEVRK